MSFFSGAIKDVESFFSGVEKPLMADFGPVLAKVRVEFSDALGNLATAEYAAAKSVVQACWSNATASNPGNLGAAVSAALSAAGPQLASSGLQIGEKVVLGLLTAVITSAI